MKSITKIYTVQAIETCSYMPEQEAVGFGPFLTEELRREFSSAEVIVLIDCQKDSCSLHVECADGWLADDHARSMVSDFIADRWDRWAY